MRRTAGTGGVLEVNWEEGVATAACSADPSRACGQGLTQDSTTQRSVVMGGATSKRPKEILAWEFLTLSMGSCGDKAELGELPVWGRVKVWRAGHSQHRKRLRSEAGSLKATTPPPAGHGTWVVPAAEDTARHLLRGTAGKGD